MVAICHDGGLPGMDWRCDLGADLGDMCRNGTRCALAINLSMCRYGILWCYGTGRVGRVSILIAEICLPTPHLLR